MALFSKLFSCATSSRDLTSAPLEAVEPQPSLASSSTPRRLPAELILAILELAVEGAGTKERVQIGLSVMLLSREWRTVGFKLMFGDAATFSPFPDERYLSFGRQTYHDAELNDTVTRLCIDGWPRQATATCLDLPQHLNLEHVQLKNLKLVNMPALPRVASLAVCSVLFEPSLWSRAFSHAGLRIRPAPVLPCRSLTSLTVSTVNFGGVSPAVLLSPRALPSLRLLTTGGVWDARTSARESALHRALLSLLPQLTHLAVFDWRVYPPDTFAHCASLTSLVGRLHCNVTTPVLAGVEHDDNEHGHRAWPRNLPPTLERLTLITACGKPGHTSLSSAAEPCLAALSAATLMDALVSDETALPNLRELVFAGPFARCPWEEGDPDGLGPALWTARGIRVERREREGVGWWMERASEGRV
ncbi:hypothetical protein JCM8208_006722 [Rhodotorula glutinis]